MESFLLEKRAAKGMITIETAIGNEEERDDYKGCGVMRRTLHEREEEETSIGHD